MVSVTRLVGPPEIDGLERHVGPLRRDDGQADRQDDPVHDEQGHEHDERAAQDGPPQRPAALARGQRQPDAHGGEHRAGHERQQAADGRGADALDAQTVDLHDAGDEADHAEEEREGGAQAGRQARVQLRAEAEDGRRDQHRQDVVLPVHAGAHEDEVGEHEVDDDGDDAGDERRPLLLAGTATGRREPAVGCAGSVAVAVADCARRGAPHVWAGRRAHANPPRPLASVTALAYRSGWARRIRPHGRRSRGRGRPDGGSGGRQHRSRVRLSPGGASLSRETTTALTASSTLISTSETANEPLSVRSGPMM